MITNHRDNIRSLLDGTFRPRRRRPPDQRQLQLVLEPRLEAGAAAEIFQSRPSPFYSIGGKFGGMTARAAPISHRF
jgi:hypothetical protein